ncbi:hypothetical protein [Thalassospira xiamenensis]|uniref:Uncharacterized protein n=1 Tax=Thalassospira xiamenensis TaxID=220697 RepID=A0A285TUE5_9PROT|nr:hypothetical protein [Thalassospira xiamenensis]SOC27503.1 hypothetical protein SAMN05428964_105441 [Thalassospira xiamenensis]
MALLLNKRHPVGGAYVETLTGGKVLAGETLESASEFENARAAYDQYRPLADSGDHSAWNICYTLEGIAELKEEKLH